MVYRKIVAKPVLHINYIRFCVIRALVGLIDNNTTDRDKLQNLVDVSARYLISALGL